MKDGTDSCLCVIPGLAGLNKRPLGGFRPEGSDNGGSPLEYSLEP
jgi:hypothetical protein